MLELTILALLALSSRTQRSPAPKAICLAARQISFVLSGIDANGTLGFTGECHETQNSHLCHSHRPLCLRLEWQPGMG